MKTIIQRRHGAARRSCSLAGRAPSMTRPAALRWVPDRKLRAVHVLEQEQRRAAGAGGVETAARGGNREVPGRAGGARARPPGTVSKPVRPGRDGDPSTPDSPRGGGPAAGTLGRPPPGRPDLGCVRLSITSTFQKKRMFT